MEYKYGGLVEPIDGTQELLERVTGVQITHVAEEITARIRQIAGAAPADVGNTGRRTG